MPSKTEKKQLQLVDELIKKQRPTFVQSQLYKLYALLGALVPLWFCVVAKALPFHPVQLLLQGTWPMQDDDWFITLPVLDVVIPATPLVVLVVCVVVTYALRRAYHHQFLTQEKKYILTS
jgi:hypothetical protein